MASARTQSNEFPVSQCDPSTGELACRAMILTNARLILPDGIRAGLEVLIEDGKIAAVRERSEERDVVDLQGNYLAPGFIDLHVHGGNGRDAMEASADAFREICGFHASGGTTSLLLTTITAPIPDIVQTLRAIRAAQPALLQIAGAHVEGPFISRQRAGAQRAEFISDPLPALTEPIFQFADVLKRMTLAPELPGALELVGELQRRGISASAGHSDAWEEEVRAAFERGLRSSTHTFNCMSSARRRGRTRIAGLLEFALSEPEMSCELIADGHHVTSTLMKMLSRAKGTRGICLVTDATAGAGLPEGTIFQLGGRECVVSDGACLLANRSALAGGAARMIDLIKTMILEVGVSLPDALLMATENPAHAIGLESRKGAIAVGADADLVVISPELKVRQTYLGGRKIFECG